MVQTKAINEMPFKKWSDEVYELEAHGDKFYFSPTQAKVDSHPFEISRSLPTANSRTKKSKLVGLQLEMVHGCNLACSYCAVGQGNFLSGSSAPIKSKVITMEVIQQAVQWMFQTFDDLDSFEVLYYGGEPLLFPDIMEQSAEYIQAFCNERGVKSFFKVVTNGTIVNERILNTFSKYKMGVQLSVDGPPELHDAVRIYPSGKGSFHRIKKNFDEMMRYGNIDTHVLAVYKPGAKTIVQLVDEMEKWFPEVPIVVRMETPQCSSSYKLSEEQEIKMANDIIEEYKGVSMEIIKRLEQGLFLKSIQNLLNVFHSSFESTRKVSFAHRSCSVGNRLISVGPNGKVNPCHGFPMTGTRSMGTFKKEQTDVSRAHLDSIATMVDVDTRQPCSSCFARYHCGGYCSVVSEHKTGSISNAWTGHCHAIRAKSVYGLWLYQTIKDRFPEVITTLEMNDLVRYLRNN